MEVFSADQLSVTHKENLHYGVLLIPRHGDHIAILHALACDLLLLGHLPDAV